MNKKLIVAALSSALALPLATTVHAENSETSGASASSTQAAKSQRNDMRASDLIGKNVRNQQGQDLGEVEDVLVNVNSGRVQYTVLSFGGTLGMGDKLFAFPLDAFDRSQQRDHLVLNVSEERLKNAEGFDKNNWPNYRNDPGFFERVRNFFGTQSTQDDTAEGQRHMMRLSEMLGQDVNDRQGRDLGEIEDIVVDVNGGRISYVALDFDAEGSEDRLIPVPLKSLSAPRESGGDLVLNIEKERLDQKRGIDPNNWPNLNDQEHQRSMDRYFTSMEGSRTTAQDRRQETSGASEDREERVEREDREEQRETGRTSAGANAGAMTGPTQPRPADDTTNRLREN